MFLQVAECKINGYFDNSTMFCDKVDSGHWMCNLNFQVEERTVLHATQKHNLGAAIWILIEEIAYSLSFKWKIELGVNKRYH